MIFQSFGTMWVAILFGYRRRIRLSICVWTGDEKKFAPNHPNYIFGQVQLFGNLGAPIYYALIGYIPKNSGDLTLNCLTKSPSGKFGFMTRGLQRAA